MMTPNEILSFIKTRKIQLMITIDGRFIARTQDGSRLSPGNVSYASPEEAIEAANTTILDSEDREIESKASKIIRALEKGEYFIRPRTVQLPDQDTKIVFSAFLSDGNSTPVVDKSTLIQAVIDMENLTNEPSSRRNSR